jgi:Cys-rich protein (TIGR01571 family)
MPGMMPGMRGGMRGGGGAVINQQPTGMKMGDNSAGCAQQSTSTNVIVNTGARGAGLWQRPWFAELFGCLDSLGVCFCGLFCPFIYMFMVYQAYGEGCMAPLCLPPHISIMALRIHARNLENISGSIFNDCVVSLFCFQCVLCQLRREWDLVLRFRGHRIGFPNGGGPPLPAF